MLAFLMETKQGPRTLAYEFWAGRRLRSSRECPLAFDAETEWVADEREVPRLALASASDGRSHVLIHPDRLGACLTRHRDDFFVGHNVQFDFWVADRHLGDRGEAAARRVLWDACDRGRLFDTQILDMLRQLATGKFRHTPAPKRATAAKGDKTKVYPGTLADLMSDYTSMRVSKADPYRGRFGELIGLAFTDWSGVEPGFFEYAVRDAAATHALYPAMAGEAYSLMFAHGFNPAARRYDIRPDALREFGYLSEVVQVKASIVLKYMFRRGVRVDLERARALEARFRAELDELIDALKRDFSEVLTFGKDGRMKLRPKSRTPSLADKKLAAMLERVVGEIRGRGQAVEVPMAKGKKKGMSRGAKEWARHAASHPFLRAWAGMGKLSKLLEFCAKLEAPVLHPEYALLIRTGRTACSKPRSADLPGVNLQQVPKLPEFRSLFVASSPGGRLFTGDFAAVELRTLAAVCKARFGRSRLGDVIVQGTDPHAFTAAAIQGVELKDFMTLKETDSTKFKEARSSAKAINFGVPGGLGATSLMAYAKAKYGVALTPEQAAAFRRKLIDEIYPELNDRDGYLADDGMAALARNLGVKEREAWEVFDPSGGRNPLAARGTAKVIRGTSTASEWYQSKVWGGLVRLAETVRGLDPEIAELVAARQGCQRLHDRLYWQSAKTLTGRIRAGVGYTDGKNTPFQSLAADGAKLALWNLLYAGFEVYGFIHDEILVQLPADDAEKKAREVEAVMVRSMEAVTGHGIPAACEYVVADCWKKG
jgi:hypothetical protein